MKQLFSAFLALVLMLSLCACDRLAKTEEDTPETTKAAEPEQPEEPEGSHKKNPNNTPIVGEDPVPEDDDDVIPSSSPNPNPQPQPQPQPQPNPNPNPTTTPEPDPEPEPEPEKPSRPEKIEVTDAQLQKIEAEFLVLINQERTRVGLNTITINDALDNFAQTRATEIITLFAHQRPDGKNWDTVLNRDEYPYVTAGENIVMTSHVGTQSYNPNKDYWTGSPEQISAAAAWAYKLFRESPVHYENMTNASFKETGIGLTYVMDSTGAIPIFYLAHLFGAQ